MYIYICLEWHLQEGMGRGFHDTRQASHVHEDAVELLDTDGSVVWEAKGHSAVYYVGHDHEFRGYIATRSQGFFLVYALNVILKIFISYWIMSCYYIIITMYIHICVCVILCVLFIGFICAVWVFNQLLDCFPIIAGASACKIAVSEAGRRRFTYRKVAKCQRCWLFRRFSSLESSITSSSPSEDQPPRCGAM